MAKPGPNKANVVWIDTSASPDRVMGLDSYQKLNHFPGMYQICRKSDLARSLGRMTRVLGSEFDFAPRTWVLPEGLASFKVHIRNKKVVQLQASVILPRLRCVLVDATNPLSPSS